VGPTTEQETAAHVGNQTSIPRLYSQWLGLFTILTELSHIAVFKMYFRISKYKLVIIIFAFWPYYYYYYYHFYEGKGKGKAIPLHAWTGP
jgi:hypothetical protein